jgi:hypothetical protein
LQRNRVRILALAASLFVPAGRALAQVPRSTSQWRVIGRLRARPGADHESLPVQGLFDNYRRIKFRIAEAPLEIVRVAVTYDNGMPDRIEVRQRIDKDAESRAIELHSGGRRSVRKVEFWYVVRAPAAKPAEVTILGMR